MPDRIDQVSILRVFDEKDACLFGLCRPESAVGMLKFLSSEEDGDEWCDDCHDETSVILDTCAPLQITDPETLKAVGSWLFAAAMWLESMQRGQDDDE